MHSKPTIKRILFATDFLASSRLALDYAVAFAKHFHATVVMLHALELPHSAKEVETETHRFSMTRKHALGRLETVAWSARCLGVDVEMYVEDGEPSKVILDAIRIHSADLLVLGIHGVHRGLSHLLIGSNTEKILLSATCPTMTVGAHVPAGVDPALHFKEILYFSDFTPEATAAAPYAAFLGDEFKAPVDVCQLLPTGAETHPPLLQERAENYSQAIREVFPAADASWGLPSFHLDRGMEFDELIDRAGRQHAGLIVLGVHTESQLIRHLHTSFAYQLLSKASCPVISIRYDSQADSATQTTQNHARDRAKVAM